MWRKNSILFFHIFNTFGRNVCKSPSRSIFLPHFNNLNVRSIVDFYLFYHIKYCVKLYFIMRKLLFESKGLFYGKILILVFVIFNCETMSIGYDLINRVTCCY